MMQPAENRGRAEPTLWSGKFLTMRRERTRFENKFKTREHAMEVQTTPIEKLIFNVPISNLLLLKSRGPEMRPAPLKDVLIARTENRRVSKRPLS